MTRGIQRLPIVDLPEEPLVYTHPLSRSPAAVDPSAPLLLPDVIHSNPSAQPVSEEIVIDAIELPPSANENVEVTIGAGNDPTLVQDVSHYRGVEVPNSASTDALPSRTTRQQVSIESTNGNEPNTSISDPIDLPSDVMYDSAIDGNSVTDDSAEFFPKT